MRKLILAIFIVMAAALGAAAQTQCKTLYAPKDAGLTICPPDTLAKITEGGFDMFCKTSDYTRVKCLGKTSRFLLFADRRTFPASIEASAFESATGKYENADAKAQVKAMDYFVTSSGEKGTRTIIETGQEERELWVFYSFGVAKGSFGFSARMDVSNAADLALADSMMKTVVILK